MKDNTIDNLVGKQLGDYKLTSLLAEGGMAKIYRAVDIVLEREVAVKVLSAAMIDVDTTLAERFQREARAVAKLEHDNIIPIYRAGHQDGFSYLAMKLIQGKDLADEIEELKQQYKLMNPRRMLHILEQVASALDFAHKVGVVHRDIKPSNILIDTTGKALLSDFGLVLQLEVDKTMGTAFGTPRYISPEQALASEKAVPASDIYSLAVIVYEILTGQMLFEAENAMQIALSHISETPRSPHEVNPDIPETIDREIMRALEKDPSKRHATAGEFVAALKNAYGDMLPSPREIAPELAQSHTPIMKTPPDFEKLLAEQRKDPVKTPKPATNDDDKTVVATEDRPIDLAKPVAEPTPMLSQEELGGIKKTKLKYKLRFRLLLFIAVMIGFEGLILIEQVAGEYGYSTFLDKWEEIFEDRGFQPVVAELTEEPTLAPTETATDTEEPTVTDTDEPTAVATDDLTETAEAIHAVEVTDEPTDTAAPTVTDTDEPTDTAEPTVTNTDEPTDTAEPTHTPAPTDTPTNTPVPTLSFTPGQGEPIVLLYNFSVFALRNDSEAGQTLDLNDLVFVREDGTAEFNAGVIMVQTLPAGKCLVIAPDAQMVETPEEWRCDDNQVHNLVTVPADALFWRQNINVALFEIRVGDSVLQEYPTLQQRGDADTHEGVWPMLVTGE